MTQAEKRARKMIREGASPDDALPAMEEADRETGGLAGVWKRALSAVRGGRTVRSKEREPKEGPS